MATSGSAAESTQQSARKGAPSRQAARGMASMGTDTDVEEDELFGLASVLYHSLQGASAARKYIADAQQSDDEELKEFFQRCREGDAARASEAKRLLVARVDEEDEEDEGSARASGEESEEEDEEDDE